MRHQKTNIKLNRTASHRKALLMNQTRALIEHKKITTTLAKAKATRSYAERLITFAKKDDVAARRQVLKKLHSRDAVKTLFHEIGPRFRDRNGGYTRIIKLENRNGDNAPMAILELVGFAVDEPVKTGRKRRRPATQRKTTAKKETAKATPVKEEAAAETTEEAVEEKPAEAAAAVEEAEEVVEEAAAEEAEATEEVVDEAQEAKAEDEAPVEEEEKKPEAEAAEETAEEAKEDDKSDDADEGEEEKKKD